MPRYLQCGFIDQDDLLRGRWRAALERLATAAPREKPATNGAEIIARIIVNSLAS
jgi:hypothetical protein